MPGEASNWIILRCQGRNTLRLAETLARDGFAVWTPRETRRIRIPRANVRREAVLPLMPSYVFAQAHHLIDLIQLALTAGSFSIMRWHDMFPTVEDRHLNGLRTLEARRTPRKKAAPLPVGVEVKVKMEGGSYAGMTGKVERSDKGWTLVGRGKGMSFKIATSLLEMDAEMKRAA